MAALSAAWRLSHDETIRSGGSITVYQRGWRLGGKGASSRGLHGRIEEHGLHVWLGYYDNAFRVMRECYAELNRQQTDPACPIATWRDAFSPSDAVGLATRGSHGWAEWTALFSSNHDEPGAPTISTESMSPTVFVSRALTLLKDFFASLPNSSVDGGRVVMSADPRPPGRNTTVSSLIDLGRRAVDAAMAVTLEAMHLSINGVRSLPETLPTSEAVSLLESFRSRLSQLMRRTEGSSRMFELLDLVATSVRGILADGLLTDPRGFAAVNGEEYRDWLRRHGAAEETFESPLVVGVYDLVFGFRHGDPTLPSFAAGTGLFLSAKIFFDYKGSIFWKMQAGMGDVVFAPLYQALRSRGVRFEFFHDVRELTISADGQNVETVLLSRQAALRSGVGSYEPLMYFGGVPCFPDAPDATQLVDPVDQPRMLETLWCRDRSGTPVELRHNIDFDVVVFGLSVGMVPFTCGPILEYDQRWRSMVRKIGTVATQSVQLWLHPSETELGWAHPGSTLTGYVKPFDTVASMSHLRPVEQWPDNSSPGSIFYFCNTLPDDGPPGPDDQQYFGHQQDRVRRHAVQFFEHDLARLMPGSQRDGAFAWDLLVDPSDAAGAARLTSQYWTANVDPSDRYVQSLPGTDRYRLRPDDSGFANLFLAGDWTDCGLNAGCIEAAAVSGLQAANAVLGRGRWDSISGGWGPLVGTGADR